MQLVQLVQLVVEHEGLEGDRQRVELQVVLPHHPGGQARQARVHCGVGDLKRDELVRAVKSYVTGRTLGQESL